MLFCVNLGLPFIFTCLTFHESKSALFLNCAVLGLFLIPLKPQRRPERLEENVELLSLDTATISFEDKQLPLNVFEKLKSKASKEQVQNDIHQLNQQVNLSQTKYSGNCFVMVTCKKNQFKAIQT